MQPSFVWRATSEVLCIGVFRAGSMGGPTIALERASLSFPYSFLSWLPLLLFAHSCRTYFIGGSNNGRRREDCALFGASGEPACSSIRISARWVRTYLG